MVKKAGGEKGDRTKSVSFAYASRSLYLKLSVLAALRFLSSGLCSAFQA